MQQRHSYPFLSTSKEIKLRKRYHEHAVSACVRGILFRLTFEEWLKVWKDSGELFNRGTRRGQYVMGRNNDKGPYKLGNIRIITNSENAKELWENKGDYIREKIKGRYKGRILSDETKLKMSISNKESWKKRKLQLTN